MNETRPPKKSRRVGWHNAYIVAAIHAGGTTLRKLSVSHGYAPSTLSNCLHTPWPKGERIIGDFIRVPPQELWPERYDDAGRPLSGHGQRKARGQGKYVNVKRSTTNSSTDRSSGNVPLKEAV